MSLTNTPASAGFAGAFTESLTPKFAISYLRVSSRGQAERGGGDEEGFSIPAQREANKRKAIEIGAMVGKEFVDRGASARSADRPELQKMLEYIKENSDRIDYVIVHKVDRLARNREDDVEINRIFRECGVILVSTSENIDRTPTGMLLHGIMASVAEFYSENLRTEVKKGLHQKVKSGGTPNKAPLGYKNIRDYDEMGRRNSRVELDPERAPLVTLAFKEYALNKWSISGLAEYLADMGLATPATPKLPSKPINKKMLHEILHNLYYKGIIVYNGVEYQGKHDTLVDSDTWDKVQEVLRSHINGERSRIHEHYLKSTVYCGKCGARLIIHNAKSRSGNRYPYFVCSAKHNKRNDCNQRSLLIDEVAGKIEALYQQISFTTEFRNLLQGFITEQIDKLAEESQTELTRLKLQKDKLEREQHKLLQAHYADAIPLHMLKEEQERIGRSLKNIIHQMEAYQNEYAESSKNLNSVFELLDDCGRAYRLANDFQKRCFNQAIFEKILVFEDLTLEAGYVKPFDAILNPQFFTLKSRFEKNILGNGSGQPKSTAHCALLNINDTINTETSGNFFTAGLSMDFLVPAVGLEPTRCCHQRILSPPRLPFRHTGLYL